jgi:antitoxin component YwqK of YwqJK toxin-antitoxin module
MEFNSLHITFFLCCFGISFSQPILPGEFELQIVDGNKFIGFESLFQEKDCPGFSQCKYTADSRDKRYTISILSCSFNKRNIEKAVSLNNKSILINTGTAFQKKYCISRISIFNNMTGEKQEIIFEGGVNTNRYSLSIPFFPRVEKINLGNIKCEYKTVLTPLRWMDSKDTKKIYLDKTKSYELNRDYNYNLLFPADSLLINIKNKGDMGITHSTQYSLRDSLRDGKYEILVNGDLRQEGVYKNRQKQDLWIEYQDNGERREVFYRNGKRKGPIREFYDNNQLKRISRFKNRSIKSRTTYFKSGKVKMKEFFENGKCIQIETYNEGGKLEARQRFTFLKSPEEEHITSYFEEIVIPGFLEFGTLEDLSFEIKPDEKFNNTYRFFRHTSAARELAFGELVKADVKALSDILKIGDDARNSWHLLKNNMLHKTILEPYIK